MDACNLITFFLLFLSSCLIAIYKLAPQYGKRRLIELLVSIRSFGAEFIIFVLFFKTQTNLSCVNCIWNGKTKTKDKQFLTNLSFFVNDIKETGNRFFLVWWTCVHFIFVMRWRAINCKRSTVKYVKEGKIKNICILNCIPDYSTTIIIEIFDIIDFAIYYNLD